MPGETQYAGNTWETTPMDIAKKLENSKTLINATMIAKVNGELFDMMRPLEESCKVEYLGFDNEEGRSVFWHSSAHALGEACEDYYGCHLCMGPPVEDGFYYEMFMGNNQVSSKDFPALEMLIKKCVKDQQPFERLLVKKTDLLEMFKHNEFKLHLIRDKVPDGSSTTVYRCGPLIDLCKGPHVSSTGRIKALKLVKNSSSYWLGNAENANLQRIYGISFPDANLMKDWEEFQKKALESDHRLIGKQHELFFFHEWSPGGCFFMPAGAQIYNTLIEFIRSEYRKRGFTEVITPNIYNIKLWEQSGHWENYHENMFSFDVENEKFALKPMNCPGHCLMFSHRVRSYRELPIRFADFGVLHRNELSGTLTGLTRVRRFQQDDAHIFCTNEQLAEEITEAFDFLKHVYGTFGFAFALTLSTRPEKFLGDIETWNKAEKQLEDTLNRSDFEWKLDPGDGAFYGPKIDICITDALKRRHQCGTIQLDFQLPIRFNLKYMTADQTEERPVIIHRAILGSVERMIAILTENYSGKFPLWLSPKQICVIPVAQSFDRYAREVRDIFHANGFNINVDLSNDTLSKKIRNAQMHRYNYLFVVGEKEMENHSVAIRILNDDKVVVISIEETLRILSKKLHSKSLIGDLNE